MSKSFQQLLFFIIISIPPLVQAKNGFQNLSPKTIHTVFYGYFSEALTTNDFLSVLADLPEVSGVLTARSSEAQPDSVLKKKSGGLSLAKDAAIIILSGILIMSFFRFRKIRKKQRSRLRQIIRSRRQSSESDPNPAAEEEYCFPNISIEETFGDEKQPNRPKTESLMTPETETKLLELLDIFENGTLYNSKNMSLPFLAGELNTNTKYLSFVINRYKSADFKTYINRLRIQYIVKRLSGDEKYRQYKISILADECGFSSHSKFASVFKTMTDYSPSAYIKLLDAGNQPEIDGFFVEEMSL